MGWGGSMKFACLWVAPLRYHALRHLIHSDVILHSEKKIKIF